MHITTAQASTAMILALIVILLGLDAAAFGEEPCSQANLVEVIKHIQPYLPGSEVSVTAGAKRIDLMGRGFAGDCDAECFAKIQVEQAQATLHEQQAHLEQIRREKALRARVDVILKECQP